MVQKRFDIFYFTDNLWRKSLGPLIEIVPRCGKEEEETHHEIVISKGSLPTMTKNIELIDG